MRTSNPAFNNEAFAPKQWGGIASDLRDGPRFGSSSVVASSHTMTVRGTIIKTAVLLTLTIASAVAAAVAAERGLLNGIGMGAFIIAGIASLLMSLVIIFKPATSPVLAPIYAVLKGAALGVVSFAIAKQAGDKGAAMVMQAVALTFGIFAALLGAFSFGLIRIGGTMMKIIVVATIGVALTYVAQMIAGMMGFSFMMSIHQAGAIGIGFSILVVVLASLNLVLDFQMIEQGVENQAPKYMEWYGGFALLVTLVWLYLEILRLLSKLNRRD